MIPLIGLLTFASVALVALEVLRPQDNRIAGRAGAVPREPGSARRTDGTLISRLMGPVASRSSRGLVGLLPQNLARRVDQMLIMADEPWTLPGFIATWALVAVGTAMLFWYVAQTPSLTTLQLVLYGALIIPFILALPYAVLRNKVRRRQKAIVRALPDAMDLLVTSIEAGLGIDAAFAVVAEKTRGPISETVSLYLRQVGFGLARREALLVAAERTGVADLIGIARSVNQAEQLGTTLGDVLRVQAGDLRTKRRQRAQAAAQRAPVLMTIPMTLCFLPAMGAVIIVPSMLNLVRFVGGMGGG